MQPWHASQFSKPGWSTAKIFLQFRESLARNHFGKLLWSFKASPKNFYIGSGWLASLTLYFQTRRRWILGRPTPPSSLPPASGSVTFIFIGGADGDDSQADVCVLIHAHFVQPLSKDGLVVVDVADENPHVRRVCGRSRNGAGLNCAPHTLARGIRQARWMCVLSSIRLLILQFIVTA